MTEFIITALLWVICGFVATGISYAYFQRHYSISADYGRRDDIIFSILFGFFGGPFAMFIALVGSRFARHGFLLPGMKP